ncbi:MAG: DUF6600 domain-containing protein [Thermoanaerobaculia bacterium]
MIKSISLKLSLALAAGALLWPAVSAFARPLSGQGYGYLLVADGRVELSGSYCPDPEEVGANQPLLTGDHLALDPASRAEAQLPDGSLLALGGGADLELLRLAGSPDQDFPDTRLRLRSGELLVLVPQALEEGEATRIDLPNARLYLENKGSYSIRVAARDWAEVVVREGTATLETERGAQRLRADEHAIVEGERWPHLAVENASGYSQLERWAANLNNDYDYDENYGHASLESYGSWVEVGHRRAWRPRVGPNFRPYSDGHWYSTPDGLVWVANEPWGWVPYHYGSWDFVTGYGWVWYPGHSWAPAWVTWYWTPSYVGWCPQGYFDHYQRGWDGRWADGRGGEHGSRFAEWTFLPTERLRHRDQARYTRSAREVLGEGSDGRLEGGVITTDTRGITPQVLEKPTEVVRVLATRPERIRPSQDEIAAREPRLERKPQRVDGQGGRELEPAKPAEPEIAPRPQLGRVGRAKPPERFEEGKPVAGGADPVERVPAPRPRPTWTAPTVEEPVIRQDSGTAYRAPRPVTGVRPRPEEPKEVGGKAPEVRLGTRPLPAPQAPAPPAPTRVAPQEPKWTSPPPAPSPPPPVVRGGAEAKPGPSAQPSESGRTPRVRPRAEEGETPEKAPP